MNDLSRRGLWLAGIGCACQVAGFAWDAARHRQDPALSGREAVLSFTSPSHLLIAVGLGLTAAGVAWALYFLGTGRLSAMPSSAAQGLGAIVIVALLVTTGGAAMATGGIQHDHSHAEGLAADGHTHGHGGTSDAAASVTGPVADELAAILKKQGLEKALDRLEALAASDQAVLSDAHNYAHELGRAAFYQYGSAKAAFSRCREDFQSGCYHGVLEAHFDANPKIDPVTVAALCDATVGANATLALRFQCVHGLGHGLTAHADHNIFQALTFCDFLKTDWDRQSCYGGTFMENIIYAQAQATGHQHDHGGSAGLHQVYVKSDDLLYPCDAVGEVYKLQCFMMQTSIILWQNGYNYAAAFQTCETAQAAYVSTCYQSMGRDISGNTLRDTDQSLKLCGVARGPNAPFCYVGAVKNFIDVTWRTDQASDFCRRVPTDAKSACYQAIGEQVAVLYTDQSQRASECAKMEPDFISACDTAAAVHRQS